MVDFEAKSLIEYLYNVNLIEKEYGIDKWRPKMDHIWFRGVTNADNHHLIPTIYREPIESKSEREINRDFKLQSRPFTKSQALNDLELLFIGRHHGLPTRLLDWSAGSLISLYFAVHEYKEPTDGMVWLLRPRKFNKLTINLKSIPSEHENKKIFNNYLKLPIKQALPMAIRSSFITERIISQKGFFTIHGSENISIESIQKANKKTTFLKSVRIPFNNKVEILNQLAKAGISQSTLFPDLDGLSAEIRDRYNKERIVK